jgi:hypothetical protein
MPRAAASAGGDVVMLAKSGARRWQRAREFFFAEYRLNHLLFTYDKPTVAFMDGVTMGGGVGISQPCRYRVATENTRFAMPETSDRPVPRRRRRLVPVAAAGPRRPVPCADRRAARRRRMPITNDPGRKARRGDAGHAQPPQGAQRAQQRVLKRADRRLRRYDADDAQRCLVLTGSGEKAFAAGADIKEMQPQGFADMYSSNFFAGWEKVTRPASRGSPRSTASRSAAAAKWR